MDSKIDILDNIFSEKGQEKQKKIKNNLKSCLSKTFSHFLQVFLNS